MMNETQMNDMALSTFVLWFRLFEFVCSDLQIVAQKKMVKPLLLKYGKYAGKSTITVRLDFIDLIV